MEEATKSADQKCDVTRPQHLDDGARALSVSAQRDECQEVANEEVAGDARELRALPCGARHPAGVQRELTKNSVLVQPINFGLNPPSRKKSGHGL